jgi:hypothetical protein
VHENEVGKTHQLLVYANDVNLLDENINIIQRKTHKTSENGGGYKNRPNAYVFLSRLQNTKQSRNIK